MRTLYLTFLGVLAATLCIMAHEFWIFPATFFGKAGSIAIVLNVVKTTWESVGEEGAAR
ncbi:MAG: hypothetical protein R2822_13425 [Spirosomataceae bacterium]